MEQNESDEILRALARIAEHQHLINEKQQITNDRLVLAIERLTLGQERLELILQAIKDILGRGNGRQPS